MQSCFLSDTMYRDSKQVAPCGLFENFLGVREYEVSRVLLLSVATCMQMFWVGKGME
jgi:hypothetical protein